MPFSRQQLPVDQAGHEDAVRPRLRAAAFDARAPVTRRAAALETLFRADWERSAPRWHRNPALTAQSYRRARIVVEHVLAPRACCFGQRSRPSSEGARLRRVGNPGRSNCAPDPTPRPIRFSSDGSVPQGVTPSEDRLGCAPLRVGAASPLRRDRADRGSSHRCVGRAWP